MSSLYYGRSPYLTGNKKSLFKKKKRSGLVMYSGSAGYGAGVKRSAGRRTGGSSGYWLNFGKQVGKNLAFGMAKTGEAVKDGTRTFKKAVEMARNIKSGKIKFEIGPAFMIIGLATVAFTMSLLYLAHYNSVATKGYDLRRLEAARQQLMTQYDIKNMKLAEAKSLSVIATSDKVDGMRRPGEVTFVQGTTAIASR